MGCNTSKTKDNGDHAVLSSGPSDVFHPQEATHVEYTNYTKRCAANWEVLLRQQENPSGKNTKSSSALRKSKVVRGHTGTVWQCVPYWPPSAPACTAGDVAGEGNNAPKPSNQAGTTAVVSTTLVGKGIHGDVQICRVVVRIDTLERLGEPTTCLQHPPPQSDAGSSSSATGGRSPVMALPVQVMYLGAMKEWSVPLSMTTRGATANHPSLHKCHALARHWRRLSAGCEGLMKCMGSELYEPNAPLLRNNTSVNNSNNNNNLNIRLQGEATSNNPSFATATSSFSSNAPRFRVYMELCRFGSLQHYQLNGMSAYDMSRLHELTTRVLMREVLLTLFYLHRQGELQLDLTARSIFLQQPVELVYGTIFPTSLAEVLMAPLVSSSSGGAESLAKAAADVRTWTLPPGTRDALLEEEQRAKEQHSKTQKQSSKSHSTGASGVFSTCVDAPVAATFANERPPKDSELSGGATAPTPAGTEEVVDDTPVAATIVTHTLNDFPQGGLSLLVPHKYSGPVVGYLTSERSGSGEQNNNSSNQNNHNNDNNTKSAAELLKLNQRVLTEVVQSAAAHRTEQLGNAGEEVLQREGENAASNNALGARKRSISLLSFSASMRAGPSSNPPLCGELLSNALPPPMVMMDKAPHTIVPTAACSPVVRPRFATRLLHSAYIRRTFLEPADSAPSADPSASKLPCWMYLSPDHLAPEVLLENTFSEESDIYSWALTFISLTSSSANGAGASPSAPLILPECWPQNVAPPRTRADRDAFRKEWFKNLQMHYQRAKQEEQIILEEMATAVQQQQQRSSASSRTSSAALTPLGCCRIAVNRGPRQSLLLYPVAVPIPPHLSTACQITLQWCLQLHPERRPSASELLSSGYFRQTDWISDGMGSGLGGSSMNRRRDEVLPEKPWRKAKQ